MVRYNFPRMCVTFNPNTEYEFKNSVYDVFADSLDELLCTDICTRKNVIINLKNIHSYRRIVHKYDKRLERWIKMHEDVISV
jgi:hypothetical protein